MEFLSRILVYRFSLAFVTAFVFTSSFAIVRSIPAQTRIIAFESADDRVTSAPYYPTSKLPADAICSEAFLPIDISRLLVPRVTLDLGGLKSLPFIIDTGSSISAVNSSYFKFNTPAGSKVYLEGFSFPTFSGGVFTFLPILSSMNAGVIGTNFLRHRVVEFHYDSPPYYIGISNNPCSRERLANANFVAINQRGYFSSSKSLARQTPVIYARMGAVIAPLEVDSGNGAMDDTGAVPEVPIVNVTSTLLQKLRYTGFVKTKLGDVAVTTCAGKYSVGMWIAPT